MRQVDLKNFAYPLMGHLPGHDSLTWLDTPVRPAKDTKTIHLVNGSQLTKSSSVMVDGKEYSQYEGFTFQSVSYGDVVGDGKEEAIVTLLYHSGGTQTTNYVYIYGSGENGPRLFAYCHTGNRAYSGLYGVHASNALLVFELFDRTRAFAVERTSNSRYSGSTPNTRLCNSRRSASGERRNLVGPRDPEVPCSCHQAGGRRSVVFDRRTQLL